MRNKRGDIRPEIQVIKMLKVVLGVVPGHRLSALSQDLFGNILNTSEAVNDRFLTLCLLRTKAGTETTITHQYRGRSVPHNLLQRRCHLDFEIQMSMDIQHAR